MTQKAEPNVGVMIRKIRMNRGHSLRALAERCGMSANAISLIERGENSPTVSSLHQLANALEVPITDFFVQDAEQTALFVKKDQGLLFQNDGLALRSLGVGLQNQELEPFLMQIKPGSQTLADPVSHPGQEFIYCLEGEVDYYVGGRIFHLCVGDSLLFQANQPHCWCNNTQESATLLMVFQAAKELHLAQRSLLE